MKKRLNRMYGNILCLAAAAGLAFTLTTGCADGERPEAGGETLEVTVNAVINDAYGNIPTSYASDGGGVSNVDGNTYCLRYILEVWTDDAQPLFTGRWSAAAEIGAPAPEFAPRLLKGSYTFVIWADFVLKAEIDNDNPAGRDLYYIAGSDLRNIALAGNYTINDEAKDAYAGTVSADLTAGGASFDVRLKRPLAKLRLVADDAPGSLAGYKSRLSYGTAPFDRYDALTGTASASGAPVVFGLFDCPSETGLAAFDYVFVNEGGMTADVTLTVVDASEQTVADITLDAVPFRPNSLSTITGNLFVLQP